MLTKLNIPKTIKVGFQERQDTYTGKLAYVTYIDDKGILRKQTSWDGWRDEKIDPVEFANEPTTGFVLNKGIGGPRQSYGWNPRNEWIRVYDPRGFEFEISVANLIFILQECSAIKGKGLEGEFVYSWDKADLVLLPVNSQEYQKSVNFGILSKKKVNLRSMKPGYLYLNKDSEKLMYLGKHVWSDLPNTPGKTFQKEEVLVFVKTEPVIPDEDEDENPRAKYLLYKDSKQIAEEISTECMDSYSLELAELTESVFYSKIKGLVLKPITNINLNLGPYKRFETYVKHNGTIVQGTLYGKETLTGKFYYQFYGYYRVFIKNGVYDTDYNSVYAQRVNHDQLTEQEVLDLCYDLYIEFENGKEVKITSRY